MDTHLRPLRDGELGLLTRVAQESLAADGVDWSMTVEEITHLFEHPEGWDSERDTVVAEAAGEVVGWVSPVAWRADEAGTPLVFHWGCVRPERQRRGIGRALLHELQARVRAIFDTRGDQRGGVAAHIDSRQEGSRALLESDGYAWTRGEFEMLRSLDEPIEDVPPPDGIEFRAPRPEEYRRVLEAADEAFADMAIHGPSDPEIREARIERWLSDTVTLQPEFWVVAWAGDEVVGSIRGFIDAAENESFGRRRGYTERITVRRPWRRRGVASAMITSHLRLLRDAGMTESGLGVDTDNPSGALRLYERLGFRRAGESGIYVKSVR